MHHSLLAQHPRLFFFKQPFTVSIHSFFGQPPCTASHTIPIIYTFCNHTILYFFQCAQTIRENCPRSFHPPPSSHHTTSKLTPLRLSICTTLSPYPRSPFSLPPLSHFHKLKQEQVISHAMPLPISSKLLAFPRTQIHQQISSYLLISYNILLHSHLIHRTQTLRHDPIAFQPQWSNIPILPSLITLSFYSNLDSFSAPFLCILQQNILSPHSDPLRIHQIIPGKIRIIKKKNCIKYVK